METFLNQGEWLTPAQAGRKANVTAMRIKQLCNEGSLVYVRTPLGRIIDGGSLARFLAERAAKKG